MDWLTNNHCSYRLQQTHRSSIWLWCELYPCLEIHVTLPSGLLFYVILGNVRKSGYNAKHCNCNLWSESKHLSFSHKQSPWLFCPCVVLTRTSMSMFKSPVKINKDEQPCVKVLALPKASCSINLHPKKPSWISLLSSKSTHTITHHTQPCLHDDLLSPYTHYEASLKIRNKTFDKGKM